MDKPKLELGEVLRLKSGETGRWRTFFVSRVIEHEEIGDVVFELTDEKGNPILVYQKEIKQIGIGQKIVFDRKGRIK